MSVAVECPFCGYLKSCQSVDDSYIVCKECGGKFQVTTRKAKKRNLDLDKVLDTSGGMIVGKNYAII